jgi:serine/threonine-protein kinase
MKATSPTDRQPFLANLRQSGLVAEGRLEAVLRELPEDARGRAVARALVEAGLLTRFQAERLLMGRTTGFHLGPYRILEQIGRGGMGRVYKAEHRTMGRFVAVKVLASRLLKTDRALDLFQREVRASARLVHPNIVTAYDANEENGRHFLVLEFVDGPNLEQLVRRQGPLTIGQACDYILQTARGLQAADAHGMVHRDVKPANILVQRRGPDDDAPGLVKISDFGLARLQAPDDPASPDAGAGTIYAKENTVMGTPDYLSPEQARDLHRADIRSDLYSLGCTFYFLLSGQVPFPGGSALDKLIRHNSENPAPLSEFRNDVPAEVEAIVRKLMARRPADRFQTPAELAAALGPFAVSGPIPWAVPPAAIPIAEPVAAADDCEVGVLNALDGSSENLSPLSATVVQDRSPTPLAPPESLHEVRILSPAQQKAQHRRVQTAIVAAVAIVAGLVALGILAALLAGG